MGRRSHSRKEKEAATSSSKRRTRKYDDDSSDYDSASDSSGEDSSPRSAKRRSRSRSRRRRDDSSDSERDSKRRKSSPKKITEEELKEWRIYLKGRGKKIERDVIQGVPLDAYSLKAEKKRQQERMAEIEKAKKRREQGAREKAQHEEEMALLARERARAEFQDWEKKEEEFHFDQSKVRSEIRLREGRTKPIDVLTKNLNPSDDMDIEINEPYMVFRGLTVKEMEELRDDIKMHLDLDRATLTHTKYWEALLIVCDWEQAEARKKDALDRARVRGEQPPPELLAEERGLHSSIEEDVKKHLQGKSYKELEDYQARIESEMRSGKAKVVEYWEAILKRLHIYKAKACLREIHAKMLREHLHRLEQPFEETEIEHDADGAQATSPEIILNEEVFNAVEEEDDEDAEAGSYSPELVQGDDSEDAIDPQEDKAILERKRAAVREEQQRKIQEAMASKHALPEQRNLEMSAMKAMGSMEEGDAMFGSGAEINLDSQVYWWHDKYRPRKPKYFNRVHTGYEWNKYNQTHYDHDNPPPKIVQGYKFNIIYPDLVDKTKAPVYTIEKDGNSSETCIIRATSAPFERGILHVYFNFKRHRYRR
uniref:Splicing factor Cactin n=2 Tax=Kalanchoe fedtschenkoi TaxID=63787 RepID=A0A7N0TPB1_KALFE